MVVQDREKEGRQCRVEKEGQCRMQRRCKGNKGPRKEGSIQCRLKRRRMNVFFSSNSTYFKSDSTGLRSNYTFFQEKQ